MSRKLLDFAGTSNLLVVILYIDFREMAISEMNSTHHFWSETKSSGIPNVFGVDVDLIVKFLVQTSTWAEREEQRGEQAD